MVLGLSETEARLRLPPIDLEAIEKADDRRFLRHAIVSNLFTIFNLDLVLTGLLTWALGSTLGALGSLTALIFNVGIHTAQAVLAKRNIDAAASRIRPQVTVIREGRPSQRMLREVVEGDLVAVALGDEIPVPGEVVRASQFRVADFMALTAGCGVDELAGDHVEPGSYCVGGHGIVRATEAGAKLAAARASRADVLRHRVPSPLMVLVEHILFGLFGLVILFSIMLVVGHYIPWGTEASQKAYQDAFAIVFRIAPLNLMLLLLFGYVIGILHVLRRGGLIYRSAAIEALGVIKVVALTVRSVLAAGHLTLHPNSAIPLPGSPRSLLGDLMQSIPMTSMALVAVARAFPGTAHRPVETGGELSTYGWQAAAFNDPDLFGTFAIGMASTMASAMQPALEPLTTLATGPAGGSAAKRRRIAERSRRVIRKALAPRDVASAPDEASDDAASTAAAQKLLFAFCPDVVKLNVDGQPRLPDGLMTLGEISVSKPVDPEAAAAVKALELAGLRTVLLCTPDAPPLAELAELKVDQAIPLEPAPSVDTVVRLRESADGEAPVALLGQEPADAALMEAADLGIARAGASPAALAVADVVLMRDTTADLPGVLSAGRRVLSGVIGTLELNLSSLGAQAGLLGIALVSAMHHFFYLPVQATAIDIFAVSLPCVVQLLFAPARLTSEATLRRRLARFVIPSASTTVVAVLGLFYVFFGATQSVATAHLVVTWAMVGVGLVNVLFVLPPTRFWAAVQAPVRDARVIGLVIIAAASFVVAVAVPLFRKWLGLGWLDPTGYAGVALALVLYTLSLKAVWQWLWRNPT